MLLADHCNRSTHYKLVFKDIRFCYRSYNSVVMFLIFPRVVGSCTLFWIERSRNILKVDAWRVSHLSKPACSLWITSLTLHWFPIMLSDSVGGRLKVTICWTVPFFFSFCWGFDSRVQMNTWLLQMFALLGHLTSLRSRLITLSRGGRSGEEPVKSSSPVNVGFILHGADGDADRSDYLTRYRNSSFILKKKKIKQS